MKDRFRFPRQRASLSGAIVRLASILSIALGAGTVSGNTLSAPDTVYANAAGNFSYRFTCTITPDSTVVGGIGWNNGTNVVGALHGDCFCFPNCHFGPGEELHFDVSGSLVDPGIWGSVENWVAFCTDADVRSITTVMPYDPTPSTSTTWGRIKRLYGR